MHPSVLNVLEAKYCVPNKTRALAVVNSSTDGLIWGLIRRSTQPGESALLDLGAKGQLGGGESVK